MEGLVLEGGGVKGSYQVGAFYAFKDCHIKLDGYVGTSIGSFNAAMLASGKYLELLDYWYNVDPGSLFDLDKNFVDMVNDKEVDVKSLIGAFSSLKKVVKNVGLDNTKLMESVRNVLSYDDLINSKYDFGLVTVRLANLKPLYVYKEDIKDQDNLIEYLMASCYFPIIKQKKIIDNHYYIDGGFFDNSPIKLLADKGYKKVYVINIKGIGFYRKIPNDIEVVHISPSRDTGLIFELDRSIIKDNIMMGYYDTLRVIKNLDGYRYCFKRRSNKYYEFITRKVDKRLLKRVLRFFKTSDVKEAVIKSMEYILEKEKASYYDVYNLYWISKKYSKDNNHFIYRFIRELKFL